MLLSFTLILLRIDESATLSFKLLLHILCHLSGFHQVSRVVELVNSLLLGLAHCFHAGALDFIYEALDLVFMLRENGLDKGGVDECCPLGLRMHQVDEEE